MRTLTLLCILLAAGAAHAQSEIILDNTAPAFATTGAWPASTVVAGYLGTNYQHHFANGEPPTAIVADNSSGTPGDTWPVSTSVAGYYGTNYQTHAAGTGTSSFAWTLNVATAGTYEVYARWTAHPNRATNAKYTVTHAAGQAAAVMNQQVNGASWQLIGTFSFDAGAAAVSLSDEANGYVIADAVMLAPPGAPPNTATWTPNVAQAGRYEIYARWTAYPNRATNATYTVTHANGSTAVAVNQQANGGAWNLLGSFTLSPGSAHKVTLTDQANGYVIADAIRLVPVALQAQQQFYFVHADHLNTPRLIADAQQRTVWRWDQQEPFGVTVPDENPSGLGAFEFPLRFPGQYADKETNLYYNNARDYWPEGGRYLQSDPIGLRGGLNLYQYARSNPISFADGK